MRALFRREYEVHMTTQGAEALQMLKDNDIDVIVADQRMPGMTGVEVLGAVKEISPRTVRILLTGYADLDAIEGSINIGEVFRFLSKPCPPNHLKETLKLAVEIAQNSSAEAAAAVATEAPAPKTAPKPAPVAASNDPVIALDDEADTATEEGIEIAFDETIASDDPLAATMTEEIVLGGDSSEYEGESTEIILSGDGTIVVDQASSAMRRVGVIVFTSSDAFGESVRSMLEGDHPVFSAKTLVQVTEILGEGKSGVLVTDFVSDGQVLRKMIGTLKRYLPELVTIVVSDDRDASEMISLINHGQVFRYMSKPAQRERFTQNVNAAVLKHIEFRENPDLLKRHQVEHDESGDIPAMFSQFMKKLKGVGRLLARG